MRTNCGCRLVEHYEESPIVSSQEITSQIPKVGFPQTTAENELRKEIIQEFCKILNNLKCGIHLDLGFILEKLALIAKAKYEHELEPSSLLEDVLRPIFNELQVDLDNLTAEDIEELLRKYEKITLLLRGPKGVDGTVSFDELTSYLRELLRGPQGILGPQGEQGPQGNPFTYNDFTQELLESLRGPLGNPFTYADFTPEQIATLLSPATEAANVVNLKVIIVDLKIEAITLAINTWTSTYVPDITSKTNSANTAALNANDAASAANTAASNANTKAGLANTAAENANTKATEAGRVNISLDGTTITITDRNGNTTTSNIKGDTGEGFSIYRTYASITAMNIDKTNVAEGKFVLIASNVEDEDNAKLYVKGAENFTFLTDLSGAQGILGNTPIILSGTIATGNSGTSVIATLTPNGNDTNGNPIYLLNLTIPRGNPFVYSDFTLQQLEGLKGKSAYLSYVDTTSDNPILSESDWITSLYGTDGITPHIDQTTGNWFIGDTNTNIKAQGPAGYTPSIDPTNHHWIINGTDTGILAEGQNGTNGQNGTDGFSPTATITKSGKIATITITDKNGTTTEQIRDGEDGQGSGDMLKSVYDSDNDGIVDNAEKVNNHTVEANVPANAKFTDTTYKLTIGSTTNGDSTNGTSLGTLESKQASENGTDLSLVTTGEKYLWNNVSDVLGNIAYINENIEGQENIPIIPDSPSQNTSIDFIVNVEEDGFYFVDELGNIGALLTENGFDAIGLHDILRVTNY